MPDGLIRFEMVIPGSSYASRTQAFCRNRELSRLASVVTEMLSMSEKHKSSSEVCRGCL